MRLRAVERKILAGFLLALVISLIVGLMLYQNATRITSTERWVRHTDEVIDQLDKMQDFLIDLDAGQRGYLLNTNEAFLRRLDSAERGIPDQVEKIAQLTVDNPVQQRQIQLLRSALKTGIDSLNQVVALRRTVGVDGARAMLADQLNKGYLDETRTILNRMKSEERRLQESRSAAHRRSICRTAKTTGIAFAVQFAILGSLFWLTHLDVLARRQAEAALQKTSAKFAPTEPEASSPATNPLRVLLTEDNPLNQQVALYQLRILGHHVDVASNGVEALRLLDKNQYDAILMDIHMPEMDGYATTTEIRQREGREKHTPIIAMTANASPADREKCLAIGMDHHLAKPVQMRDLVLALERCGTGTEPAKTEPLPQAIDLRPLIDSGMADIIPRLIEIFLQTAPRDIEQAVAAVHNSDATDLEDAAHRLKGGCSNLGAARLRELCQQMEEHGRDGSLQNTPELMAAIEEEFGRVRMELIAVRDHQGSQMM
ncbi:MAG TPA: CHASE3 domain-containing protein [Chthoniobacterales bacterium]|nr:CHASE3 domain-containing protein [Chthoniobacterales bacterium]